MAKERTEPEAPLNRAESYNAALQLHNQEFRTLGQRTTAFLIAQSILVIAFVTLLVNQGLFPYALVLIMWGVSIAGILFCLSHHIAGKSGSEAAFGWRQYMRHIEDNQQDTPWKWAYNFWEENHKKHGEPPRKRKACTWLRNLFTRLQCDKCLLERSPLPTAWITTPFIFLMIWFAVSLYVTIRLFIEGDPLRSNLLFPLPASFSISIFVSVFALGALSFVIWRCRVWWKTRRN